MPYKNVEEQAEFCKIFGNVSRIQIVRLLVNNELSVTDISNEINSSLPNTSQNLRLMKANGFVKSRREGRTIYYSLTQKIDVDNCRLITDIG